MKIFETSDFHLTISLCTLGFSLISIDKTNPKRFLFEFAESPELLKQIDLFFKGALRLDPRLVLMNSKLVKDRMYEV